MPSILDDEVLMRAVEISGYGYLVLHPKQGGGVDDEKYERMVIRMGELFGELCESEDANYLELVCCALEFSARIIASPISMRDLKRSEHRRVADEMAKNLRKRILGACRSEGPDQETLEN